MAGRVVGWPQDARSTTTAAKPRTITLTDPWSIDRAVAALKFCDSYTRLPTLLDLATRRRHRLSRTDFLRLLGENWTGCDNIGIHQERLAILVPDGPSREMMTAEEWTASEQLPDIVAIYRGAGRGVNERGLSWSIDRAVAESFPFLNRYRADQPVLVSATVTRTAIAALKLARQEAEVITKHAAIVRVEALTSPPQPTA